MGNTDNKKDFSKIFDELEETMKSFNTMFSNGECGKKDCKKECACGQEQENNKCFNNTFDPLSIFKGIKEFCDNITPEDIAKPIDAIANVIGSGAEALTGLFEKVGEAIDMVAEKYDRFIDDEETPDNSTPEQNDFEMPIAGNNDYSNLCEDKFIEEPSPYKEEMTPEEQESIRAIIEEEYNRQFPEKSDDQDIYTPERLYQLIDDSIKSRNFTFDKTTSDKVIKLEFEFNVKEIPDTSYISEACDMYKVKNNLSAIYMNAKGINDKLKVYIYISVS